MPRELIIETRKKQESDTLPNVYGAACNVVIGELTERWKAGVAAPGLDMRVQNVHLHDKDGNHIGFRMYLVWSEPIVMGPTTVEVVE